MSPECSADGCEEPAAYAVEGRGMLCEGHAEKNPRADRRVVWDRGAMTTNVLVASMALLLVVVSAVYAAIYSCGVVP